MVFLVGLFVWAALGAFFTVLLYVEESEDRNLHWKFLALWTIAFIGAFLIGSLAAKYG